jgi:hypothetical protein
MHLTQDGNQWWVVVNTVMNPRVPKKAWNFLTEWLCASQEGLCSIELVSWLVGWLVNLVGYVKELELQHMNYL